ncbi:MAG TPA: hypothetical protein VMB85_10510 [Bryobacteraceae bacterium]|nr:hypothetical protein [Bryobacteraceae bacterium]
MKVSKQSLILAAALTGLVGGTVARANGAAMSQDQSGSKATNGKKVAERHACAGQNFCKGKGGCATDESAKK